MPIEGFSSITVPDEVKNRLQKIAEKTFRTVPKLIEWMLDQCFPEEKAEVAA